MSVEMITEENLDSESREVHYVSENGRVEGLILESRQAVDSVFIKLLMKEPATRNIVENYKVVDEQTCKSKHS